MFFKTRIRLPARIKTFFVVVVSLCLVFMTILLLRTCLLSNTVENKITTYEYTQKANLDYQVLLKPNLLYEENVLGMGKIYPANFVEQLQTTLIYEFAGNKQANIKGEHAVVAIVQGVQLGEGGEKILWDKEFSLVPQTFFDSTDGKVKLKQEVLLPFAVFNQFGEEVQQATGIISDMNLVVNWLIQVEAENAEGCVKEEFSPQFTLPLGKKHFEVGGDLTPEKTGVLEEEVTTIVPLNIANALLLGLGILVCLLALLFFLYYVEAFVRSPLEKQVKAVFRKYGERLVALEKEIEVNVGVDIKTKSMEDLVRIADELCSPIYYNVKKGRAGEVVSFFVINEERIFTYDLGVEKVCAPLSPGSTLPYL